MLESPISYDRWHLLYERFGGFQFWLVDEATDEILAEGNSLPVRLDLADLPDRGWEYVDRARDERRRGADARLGDPGARRPQPPRIAASARLMLGEMRRIAARRRLRRPRCPGAAEPEEPLSADADRMSTSPGRPTEGLPFDPWLRVHARAGATIEKVCAESMIIPGTRRRLGGVDGDAVPGERARTSSRVRSSRSRSIVAADRGVYVEPNVWMHHRTG